MTSQYSCNDLFKNSHNIIQKINKLFLLYCNNKLTYVVTIINQNIQKIYV